MSGAVFIDAEAGKKGERLPWNKNLPVRSEILRQKKSERSFNASIPGTKGSWESTCW
jgi:hypothetical protein